MVNFPHSKEHRITGIYTPADGIYSLKDQRRLVAGSDWPPVASSNPSNASFYDATTYNFSGSQTSPTNLSSSIGLGLVDDFDLEFDVYSTDVTASNQWLIQNDGYYDSNGFLYGLYSQHASAIAGNGIGAYGYTGTDQLGYNAWKSIKVSVRLSVGTIEAFHDGVSQGLSSGYNQTYVDWNYMYLGMGRSTSSSSSWSNPFEGSIRNIAIYLV